MEEKSDRERERAGEWTQQWFHVITGSGWILQQRRENLSPDSPVDSNSLSLGPDSIGD